MRLYPLKDEVYHPICRKEYQKLNLQEIMMTELSLIRISAGSGFSGLLSRLKAETSLWRQRSRTFDHPGVA